jgi:hypothetical protein
MSEHVYLLTIALPLGALLTIFALKYASAAYQAYARSQGEEAYRELAERAVSTQAQTATALAAMQAELAQLTTRLGAVAKILQDVE